MRAPAPSTQPAFLGVERSATGRLWQARPFDEREAQALAQRHNLPDLVARALSARNIRLDDADGFLNPKLRDALPNPSTFKDMDKAVARFCTALERGEKVAVYGDYDVDGATSSAILLRYARAIGTDLTLYVPDRMKEGYGPNTPALMSLAEQGIKLVITVDCGTTAHEPLTTAQKAGLDVIVLDHHAAEAALPPATAIVNPNRIDENSAFGTLAAVGVTYLFIIALNRTLRDNGYFKDGRKEPDLLPLLDLVALGTVCDVVKLTGLNRTFVAQGLRIMAARQNCGINALMQVAGQAAAKADPYLAGFILGPRVNAGGRVGRSDLGARLLSTDDTNTALQLAEQLHNLNTERRELEARVLAEAETLHVDETMPMVFVASQNWHPGVIGIVASRLKDKFQHPALVVAIDGDIGKGSGRSVQGLDLGAEIIAARQAGLLINGGGHAMAAGFTVARDKIDALKTFLAERIRQHLAITPLCPTMMIDGLIAATSMHHEFVEQLGRIGPFGTGNSEPRLALADCKIIRADIVGEKHVSLIVQQGGARFRGIAFRAMENDLGPTLLSARQNRLHLAGHLRLDEWQGDKRVQLHVSDAAIAN